MLVAGCALLGLLIGSFLNVVIHRVPLGLSVVAPPSRCPGCEQLIAPRDNVPVLSWLALRGRCRHCREPISVRYPLVELATAVLFSLVGGWVGWSWVLPAYLYLTAIAVALTIIDLDVRRLPDAIVLPSFPVLLVLFAAASLGTGDWSALLRGSVGAMALGLLYLLLFVAKPGGMGLGDVKLAPVLGLALGWAGWDVLVVGAFGAFLLGGIAGTGLMLAHRAGRKSRIPFGPYMLGAALLALFVAAPLSQWYLQLIGLQPTG